MRTLRASYRLAALTALTLSAYLMFLIGQVLLAGLLVDTWRWRNFMVGSWARIALVILGVRTRIRGSRPSSSLYIVANHLSYLDIPLLFSQIGCVFVAKAELRNWPLLGFLMRSIGTIFVDRGSKKDVVRVNALIEQAIRENKTVVVFPEGTTSGGTDVLPFKPPLLEFPAQTKTPVSCATIHYSTPEEESPAHRSVCWWGDMPFASHFFHLLKLSRIDATVEFGRISIQHSDRKHLARELWFQVKQIFVPISA